VKRTERLQHYCVEEKPQRLKILLLLSALCLPECSKKADTSQVPDAAIVLSEDSAYKAFEESDYRANFVKEFAKDLKHDSSSERFFLPIDYQWQLEEALVKASQPQKKEEELPDTLFNQSHNAALALGLRQSFRDWAELSLPDWGYTAY
jgi:hypothetical protein